MPSKMTTMKQAPKKSLVEAMGQISLNDSKKSKVIKKELPAIAKFLEDRADMCFARDQPFRYKKM